jgi:uncharacterized coiled-coil protein SlyX
LKLDDVACMSVSELRKTLRKLRDQLATKEKVADDNQKFIQELQERLEEKKKAPPEEAAPPPKSPVALAEDALKDDVDKVRVALMGVQASIQGLGKTYFEATDGTEDGQFELTKAYAIRRIFRAVRDLGERVGVLVDSRTLGDEDDLPDPDVPFDDDVAEIIAEFNREGNDDDK